MNKLLQDYWKQLGLSSVEQVLKRIQPEEEKINDLNLEIEKYLDKIIEKSKVFMYY